MNCFDDPAQSQNTEHPLLIFQQLIRHAGVEIALFSISTIALHLLNEHGIMADNLLQVAATSASYGGLGT